jgi:cytoskeleton protein RodZ
MMPPNQDMAGQQAVGNAPGCGQRLRAAREAAGLSLHDVAGRLKMPVRIIEALEAEDWARIGAPVFVRGQLRS